jgi:hypothetical protein
MTWQRKGRPTEHDKPYKKEYVKVSPKIVERYQYDLKKERLVKAYTQINYLATGNKYLSEFDEDNIKQMAREALEML